MTNRANLKIAIAQIEQFSDEPSEKRWRLCDKCGKIHKRDKCTNEPTPFRVPQSIRLRQHDCA